MKDAQLLGTKWQSSWAEIPGQSARRVTLSSAGRAITFAQVLDCWINDETFRAFFLAELRLTPFVGFFWELPPLQRDTLERTYEHVVLEGNLLERISPDPAPFLNVFQAGTVSDLVASFPNIGGDAILVVPKPQAGSPGYGHLGAFLRAAPEKQQHALLEALGQTAEACLQRRGSRLWISTAGLGVPWLHVRLDSRPKYYKHQPYRVP
jgi:uncharacterized protein DUF6940